MNRKRFILIVIGVLAAASVVLKILDTPTADAVTLRADITPPASLATSSDGWSVLTGTYSVLEHSVNGDYRADYDEESKTVTVDLWRYDLTADSLNSALLDLENLKAWNRMTDSMKELELALQQEYIDHDVYGITVVLHHINPEDLTQIFATVSRGELIYDIVDETPPGMPIEGTSFDSGSFDSPEGAHNIVLNTYSRVFHNTACPYIQYMKDGHIKDFYGTREEAIAQGFFPCTVCGG